MIKVLAVFSLVSILFNFGFSSDESIDDGHESESTQVTKIETTSVQAQNSRNLYFNLSSSDSIYSGSVTATSNYSYAEFYACQSGSASVTIISNGNTTSFTIPAHGTTTIRIPISSSSGSAISYYVSWKTGGSDGRVRGSFTLYY